MKILFCVLSIVGLVVGAGLASGREIFVFFTRFGVWSFPSIILSFVIFWFLFSFFLNFEQKSTKNSKFMLIFSLIITFTFSSAMFAGINNLILFENKCLSFFLFCVVIFLCFMVYRYGLGALNKLNFIMIPIVIVVMIISFFVLFDSNISLKLNCFEPMSIIYSFFYCGLNVSNGTLVIMRLGEGMSKKQKARASFFSSLVLALLIVGINIILLQNPQAIVCDMPILFLCKGWLKSVMNFVVLFSALTSLLSLIYTSSSLIRGLCKNEILTFVLSVVLPCTTSLFGFSLIVTYFYPIASGLGVFLLGKLIIGKMLKKV